jgi:hypothetical protein
MVDGGLATMTKPDYKQMSLQELRKYILSHREDQEAWEEYANRPRPNSVLVNSDTSLSEQKQIFDNLLQKRRSN